MSDAIRVGLIGYGYASKTFHAPLISGTPGMTLAAVSSSDETKVLADWPAVKVVTAPQALFSDPDIDLVVIPTQRYPFPAGESGAGSGQACGGG
jgi:predicted dehydrogenase